MARTKSEAKGAVGLLALGNNNGKLAMDTLADTALPQSHRAPSNRAQSVRAQQLLNMQNPFALPRAQSPAKRVASPRAQSPAKRVASPRAQSPRRRSPSPRAPLPKSLRAPSNHAQNIRAQQLLTMQNPFAPKRSASPRRAQSPQRAQSPKRAQSPARRAQSPQRAQSPARRASSPKRAQSPKRAASPKKKSKRASRKGSKKPSKKSSGRRSRPVELTVAGIERERKRIERLKKPTSTSVLIHADYVVPDIDKSAWPSAASKRYHKIARFVVEDSVRKAFGARKLRLDNFFFDTSLPNARFVDASFDTQLSAGLGGVSYHRERKRKGVMVKEAVPLEFKRRFDVCLGLHKEIVRSSRVDKKIAKLHMANMKGTLIPLFEAKKIRLIDFFMKPCNRERSTEARYMRSGDRAVPMELVPLYDKLYAYTIHKRRNGALAQLKDNHRDEVLRMLQAHSPSRSDSWRERTADELLLKCFQRGHAIQYLRDHLDQVMAEPFLNQHIEPDDKAQPLPAADNRKNENGLYLWQQRRRDWADAILPEDLDKMSNEIRTKLEKWIMETRHSTREGAEEKKYRQWGGRLRRQGCKVPPFKPLNPIVVRVVAPEPRTNRRDRVLAALAAGASPRRSKSKSASPKRKKSASPKRKVQKEPDHNLDKQNAKQLTQTVRLLEERSRSSPANVELYRERIENARAHLRRANEARLARMVAK